MNVAQIKWIYNKALFLIHAYENRLLTDKDYEDMIDYVAKTTEEAKHNDYCGKIMRDVLECFDREDRKKKQQLAAYPGK